MAIDTNKSLFNNLSFWFWSLLPTTIGLMLGIIVWVDYTFSLTLEAYDRFLEISKLPLALMGLTFPASAIYVYQYKSRQDSLSAYMLKEQEILKQYDSKLDNLASLTLSLDLLKKRLSAMEDLRKQNIEPIDSIIDSALLLYMDWIDLLKSNQYISLLNREQDLVDGIESRLLALRIIVNSPKKSCWAGNFKNVCSLLNILTYKVKINFHKTHTKRYHEINDLRKHYHIKPDDISILEKNDRDIISKYEALIKECSLN